MSSDDRVGETTRFTYRPSTEWYWFPQQKPNEVSMLKCYDSVTDRVGTQPDIRNETISQHAVSHPEEYDVVCAFHAIEHVTDPPGFARPRNLHETRRTSLCCGAEPRFGNNRGSEFRAECAAALSQLVERGCVAGASRPSRSADRSD
jgi:hypothetical protein